MQVNRHSSLMVLLVLGFGLLTFCTPPPAKAPTEVSRLLIGNSGGKTVESFLLDSSQTALSDFIPNGTGGLIFPDAMLLDDEDRLYVSSGCRTTADSICDKSLSNVLRFDGNSGAFIDTFISGTTSGSSLYRPYGTAFGPDGLFYVSSLVSNQIIRYDTNGQFVDVFAAAVEGDSLSLNGPNGLAFSADGQFLYVTTEGSNFKCPQSALEGDCKVEFSAGYPSLILRYEVASGEKTIFANPKIVDKNAPPSLLTIEFGPDGRLYVTDFTVNVVRVYDTSTGAEVQTLSTIGDSVCQQKISKNPYTGGHMFDGKGNLLVAIGGLNNGDPGAVLRFKGPDYAHKECLVAPTTKLNRPIGLKIIKTKN